MTEADRALNIFQEEGYLQVGEVSSEQQGQSVVFSSSGLSYILHLLLVLKCCVRLVVFGVFTSVSHPYLPYVMS